MSFLSKEALFTPFCSCSVWETHLYPTLFPSSPSNNLFQISQPRRMCTLTWPMWRRQMGGGLPSLHTVFEHLCPSAEVKSLVEISLCSCVLLSNTDNPSQSHFFPTKSIAGMKIKNLGNLMLVVWLVFIANVCILGIKPMFHLIFFNKLFIL